MDTQTIFDYIRNFDLQGRAWTHIIIHHSLTKDQQTVDWAGIKEYHTKELGWSDIGYHFGIEMINGRLEYTLGRPINRSGAHCEGIMNSLAFGVCLVGNYDINTPTYDQYFLLACLCRELQKKCNIPLMNIHGHWCHNNYKTCPGFHFNFVALRQIIDGSYKKPI